MEAVSADREVIACNYREGVSAVSRGSLAYVALGNPGNGHDRVMLLARSRAGRWVEKWEAIFRLGNFRLKRLPPEHPLHERLASAPGEAELESLRNAWSHARWEISS